MVKMVSSNRLLWSVGFLAIVFQMIIGFILNHVDSSAQILTLQTTLDSNVFLSILISWGGDKISVFLRHYYYDFIYLIIYSTFLALCIRKVTSSKWLFLIPVLAGVCDLSENLCQAWVTMHVELIGSNLFYLGAYSARAKWALLGIAITVIFFGLVRKLVTQAK